MCRNCARLLTKSSLLGMLTRLGLKEFADVCLSYARPVSNKGRHVHSCPFGHLFHLLLGPASLGLLSTSA